MKNWHKSVKTLLVLLCALALGRVMGAAEKVSAEHKKWLEEDVVYIISKEERELFLRLGEKERDNFIGQFWAQRDPTPGTPENEYKDEHYKRIQHANTYFGGEWNNDGWRTDRGKIWIILGQPQSRQYHTSGGQVYPIELWFYSSQGEAALPSFFYVMFYQKYGASDYRLYSPYVDGPDALVRASGIENRRDRAYRFLRTINPELARASLTLIPSEPADINAPPSMTSDGMLMKIINLANDRFHKERLGLNKQMQQEVSTRLMPDVAALHAAVLPLRDAAGKEFLHYSLQIYEPPNYALGRYKDKYFLSMEASVRVMDAQKKVVYEGKREASAYFEEKELDDVRARPLSFEDRIPIEPGKYEVEFGLLNLVTRVFFRTSAAVQVNPEKVTSVTVGKPVLVQKCLAAQRADEPFVMGNSRCTLMARSDVSAGAGAALNLLYAVQVPAGGVRTAQPLRVQYTLGRLDRSVENRVIEDALDRQRFDHRGTLLVGKSLEIGDLPTGSYLLSIRITDPMTKQSSGTTLPFRVTGANLPLPNILVPSIDAVQ